MLRGTVQFRSPLPCRFVMNGDNMLPVQCVEALRSIVTAALTDTAGGPTAPNPRPVWPSRPPVALATGNERQSEGGDGSMHARSCGTGLAAAAARFAEGPAAALS
eukprot:TRINITY_DN4920_c0_g2_i1.p3 TRINITY_DN4920_c0_g2~~TRINITY_DN4920_c0_g2_i1.p3  ORF type:complete len:105 (-),score=5.07 TRINITY_DN4920_c0_g2_i1:15-329(-)